MLISWNNFSLLLFLRSISCRLFYGTYFDIPSMTMTIRNYENSICRAFSLVNEVRYKCRNRDRCIVLLQSSYNPVCFCLLNIIYLFGILIDNTISWVLYSKIFRGKSSFTRKNQIKLIITLLFLIKLRIKEKTCFLHQSIRDKRQNSSSFFYSTLNLWIFYTNLTILLLRVIIHRTQP